MGPATTWSGIGDAWNATWVGGQQCHLVQGITPDGECYNYSLFFFNLDELKNSFCIPAEGVIGQPVISPDLKRISYITVVGPENYYLMLGTVPPDLIDCPEIDKSTPAIELVAWRSPSSLPKDV